MVVSYSTQSKVLRASADTRKTENIEGQSDSCQSAHQKHRPEVQVRPSRKHTCPRSHLLVELCVFQMKKWRPAEGKGFSSSPPFHYDFLHGTHASPPFHPSSERGGSTRKVLSPSVPRAAAVPSWEERRSWDREKVGQRCSHRDLTRRGQRGSPEFKFPSWG